MVGDMGSGDMGSGSAVHGYLPVVVVAISHNLSLTEPPSTTDMSLIRVGGPPIGFGLWLRLWSLDMGA